MNEQVSKFLKDIKIPLLKTNVYDYIKSTPIHGIDISSYQEAKNWKKVSESQDFVIIKATEGQNFVDKKLNEHFTNAMNNNMIVGLYHFSTPNKNNPNDAILEAKDFAKTIKTLQGWRLKPVLDIEQNKTAMTKEQIKTYITEFNKVINDEFGCDIILYSYSSFLKSNLPKDHGLGNMSLWLAHYTDSQKPTIPQGWDNYSLWQYSSSGTVDGIEGRVDMNRGTGQFLIDNLIK